MRKFSLAILTLLPVFSIAQMPAAPKELDVFKPFIGEWAGTPRWTMMGQTTDTKATYSIKLEGNFVLFDSVTEMDGIKMTERSYVCWDSEKKMYHDFAFTNFATTPREGWGKFEKGVYTSTSNPWDIGMPEKIVGKLQLGIAEGKMSYDLFLKEKDAWDHVAIGLFSKK